MMTVATFATALVAYCESTGGSVTSWYRTAAHNRAVHGCPSSPHLAARGADVVYDHRPTRAERERLAHLGGLDVLLERDHDHLQPLGWPPCPKPTAAPIPT